MDMHRSLFTPVSTEIHQEYIQINIQLEKEKRNIDIILPVESRGYILSFYLHLHTDYSSSN